MLRVKFSGMLRQIAGRAEVLLELPAACPLGKVLDQLEKDYPGILGTDVNYQWRHGSNHVIIAVNGAVVENPEQELQLKDGDELAMLPPLGGGR